MKLQETKHDSKSIERNEGKSNEGSSIESKGLLSNTPMTS